MSAVKIVDVGAFTSSPGLSIDDLKRETTICDILKHEHIVELKEVYSSTGYLYMVFEYMSGADICFEIVKRASEGYVYSEAVVSHYIKQIFEAIRYCHLNDIIHRDLTPMCVLLQNKEIKAPVKIGRFGLAIKCSDGQSVAAGEVTTPHFMAPEMSRGEPYGKPVDLWSCGVILHLLLSGTLPFVGSGSKLTKSVQRGHVPMTSSAWSIVSDSAKNLVKRMLTLNPQERITITETLSHPWILDRKRVCMNTHLPTTIENMKKFNSRRRLRSAVVDAFSNKLHYYNYPMTNQMDLFNQVDSVGAIGQVLDSLDEIDLFRQEDPKELQDVLDDSNLHKWLDIYDNISSLGLANKSISDPGTGLSIKSQTKIP